MGFPSSKNSLKYVFTYRSGSPQTLRNIDGHGRRSTRYPPLLGGADSPARLTTSAKMPGSARVQEPGLVGVAPGRGEIMIAPVSVCHHVSTIGQRPPPITRWHHSQACGLMGSPTVPRSRRHDMSCLSGHSSPNLTKVRMAVGAV